MCCIQKFVWHLKKVCIIIGACAVLHNIATILNEPMEDGDAGDEMNVGDVYCGPNSNFLTFVGDV